MKRSGPPERKTPLKRTGGPARSELRSGSGPRTSRSAKRGGGAPESRAEKDATRQAVFDRDRRCVLAVLPGAGPCFGHKTVHHRRKEGQGGAYTLANLVSACSFHNDELEADADLAAAARERGFVVRRGDPEWDALGQGAQGTEDEQGPERDEDRDS